MDAISRAGRLQPGEFQQRSTRVAFFLAGLGMAAWAPLVPYAQDHLDVGEGVLGLLLLCLGAGSIVTMPLSGALTAQFGCHRVIWSAGLIMAASLPFLATVASALPLAATLLAFGAGFGAIGVAINVQAVIVEASAGRAVMSGFHGLFSVGGIAEAGMVSGLLWAGLSPMAAALCAAAVIVGLLLAFGAHLLPYGGEEGAPSFALPRGPVLLIGGLCFVVFLAEGAMLDWSAVVLTPLQGVDPSRAGLGYAAFGAAIAAGRLGGDRVVRALGRQRAMPANLAVAAVTTLGFSGILTGPALIGFVAHATSLPVALLCVEALLLGVSANSRAAT